MPEQHDGIRVVRPDERAGGPATPGMFREEAFATEGMWAGLVRTEPGMMSGWHHHGEHETVIYVVSGAVRFEFGADGSEAIEGRTSDFIHVPKNLIHRESNPTGERADLIGLRAGHGETTINVEGPA